MRVVHSFVYLLFLAQGPVQAPPPAPVPEGPPTYASAKGPILLPNLCAAVDLTALGQTCSEAEPCPTYLEFSTVEALGTVVVASGNTHTSSTTLQSILLISEDGGATWRESHPRIQGSALESMQFLDFANGWLAGQTSLGGLPRDPFLLLTTDSGRTWRKVDIFAESRVGLIEDFAFQTAKRGWMLIDNRGSGDAGKYEFYESQTGGTSWELREISSRIPAKAQTGQKAPSGTARVRVDEKKGLLRIELQAGNGWREVSAFRFKLEDCKPGPQ